MPTVPTYGGAQVAPTGASGAGFATPRETNATPGQLLNLGEGMTRAGTGLANIATDMQQQVNQVRVDDGLNRVRQQILDLTYNPETGYKGLRGDAALTRPDGKPLAEEYGGKLQTAISETAAKLGNDAQRLAFMHSANGLMEQFNAGLEQHTLAEYKAYSLSTQEGTIKLGVDEARRNWQDPDKIRLSLDSVKAAVAKTGQLSGWSGSDTTARMREVTSSVHTGVIETALAENNPEYALGYIDQYKGEMTAGDLLKVRGSINKDVYQRLADGIATNVVTAARSQAQPGDLGRMVNITLGSESGNRERNADGSLVTSPKGAQGAMQVMPGTQIDPGFGVEPAKDSSDAERSRVGRDYLQAMVKHYAGDPAKAWAAYNWGPGNVDAAIKEHGAGWLSHAPEETRTYVAKNLAALGSGAGVAKPTLQQIHDTVRAQVQERFGATPPAGVLKLALATATQQFEDLAKATKADEDARTTAAMQALLANGGKFSQLPYAVRSSIPADKVDQVLTFGQKVAKGDDITNPAVYQKLSEPGTLRRLSDNEFFQLRGELSEADFKHFSAQRAAALDKSTNKVEEINMSALNATLRDRFQTLGIDPTPKDGSDEAGRVGAIKKFVTDTMLAQQKITGKQMTDAEVEKHIDGLFAKSVSFRTQFLGMNTGSTSQRLLTMKADDIPGETRDALLRDFKTAGIPAPTDADLLGAYWRLKQMPPKPLPQRDTPQSKHGKIKPAPQL
jgi:soluble lytic murein transglycosylase